MKRNFSDKLNDSFVVKEDGSVVFDSGVEYNKLEIDQLKQCDDDFIRKYHAIKRELDCVLIN